jgi:hypothetical protein
MKSLIKPSHLLLTNIGGTTNCLSYIKVFLSCVNESIESSVADPYPSDPYIGPPGSGSGSQRYGSGSFYNQEKIVRKTLIPTVLSLLFDFLSLKNDVNGHSKSNKQKIFYK